MAVGQGSGERILLILAGHQYMDRVRKDAQVQAEVGQILGWLSGGRARAPKSPEMAWRLESGVPLSQPLGAQSRSGQSVEEGCGLWAWGLPSIQDGI